MAIQVQGSDGTVATVAAGQKAIYTNNRPLDPGVYGTYRVSLSTGLMAAGLAANAEILQFRWTDATRLIAIERIAFDGLGSVTAFAAGVSTLRATVARSWTVDGSGGTASVFTTNNQKLRTSFPTSLMATAGSVRIASTAALSAGTKTLDAGDVGQAIGGLTATAGAGLSDQSIVDVMATGYPLILAQNEGFVIRATVPITGTWTAGFTIHWTELASY